MTPPLPERGAAVCFWGGNEGEWQSSPLPSGSRTNADDDFLPREPSSFWKWFDRYKVPLACRAVSPTALSWCRRRRSVGHGLSAGLQGLKTGAPRGGADAQALPGAVVHRREHAGLAFAPWSASTSCRWPTGPWVPARSCSLPETWACSPPPVRRQQRILPHVSAKPVTWIPDTAEAQASPELAVPYAAERRWKELQADFGKQGLIGQPALWIPLFGWGWRRNPPARHLKSSRAWCSSSIVTKCRTLRSCSFRTRKNR